jgi:phospho-N-acetylmuramoyl-pentapeptide-transferase
LSKIFISLFLSFLLSIFITPVIIKKLKKNKIGQSIRTVGPYWHISKEGTPNMGGVGIILSLILTLIFLKEINITIFMILICGISFAVLGLVDDYYNIKRRQALGIKARHKILIQIIISLVFSLYLFYKIPESSKIKIPFLENSLDLNYLYIPFAIIILLATTNAVNLTDGIDGLAVGCVIIAMTFFLFISLHLKNFPLSIFISSIIGGSLGFLWYNIYPAKVFMGNVGSLFLGASLGFVSLITKTEILLILIGMIFVIEALSVIIQVIYFQTTGKRIFKMSPIHHHFELSGWSESQVTTRFWILTLFFGIIGWLFFKK